MIPISEGMKIEVNTEEVKIYAFPKSMEYVQYYNAFCRVFYIDEKRGKLQVLKAGDIIEIRNKRKSVEEVKVIGRNKEA